MKIKIHLLRAALLLSAFGFPLSAFSQGSLTPPGAPAPTMKSLAQIEPRTPISSAPFTITAPGSYYLTTNLTVSGGDAITIATNNVTLDLNGFTIASTAASATGTGISIYNVTNLAILNGFIQGGVIHNGNAGYSGSGFGSGIYGSSVQNARVSGVSVSGCLNYGIFLVSANSSVVDSCTVLTVGVYGIVASTIKASMAKDCGGPAIYGDQVADCRGESPSDYGLFATTAQNCYGLSGNATGLSAHTAQNCYGYSSTGTGLYAYTAQNCYGYSSTGNGLNAVNVAQNCYGYSSSGTGLYAFLVNNCIGQSYSSYGIFAYDIATGSYGNSTTGIGLRANIANSCDSNTHVISYPYNMP